MNLIVTQGPYSSFLAEVAQVALVQGIRLNTVMPVKEGRIKEKLAEMKKLAGTKDLWIDLKARQLRITGFANTPFTTVSISHRLKVDLPALAYFDNGRLTGRVVDIDGHRLILEDYVGRLLGPGESVNIVDPSLEYLDPELFTPLDLEYIEAAGELGLDHFMLSYTESAADLEALKTLRPEAVVTAKLENLKGLARLKEIAKTADLIMAARGDLYTEIEYPHQIAEVMKQILAAAPDGAVAASRILESLLRHPVPSCADMMDLAFLKDMGYRHFLIGDDICFKKELLMRAFRIFSALAET